MCCSCALAQACRCLSCKVNRQEASQKQRAAQEQLHQLNATHPSHSQDPLQNKQSPYTGITHHAKHTAPRTSKTERAHTDRYNHQHLRARICPPTSTPATAALEAAQHEIAQPSFLSAGFSATRPQPSPETLEIQHTSRRAALPIESLHQATSRLCRP